MKEEKYKISLILGLDCGKKIFNFLSAQKNIKIVKTFVKDPIYKKNIAGYINFSDVVPKSNLVYYKNVKNIYNKIKSIRNLDLIIAIGISDIISNNILKLPKLGVVGAHAAKLPNRPGCSPIIWAILDKLKETEMTIFKMSKIIDNGNVYASKKIKLSDQITSTVVREKMDLALLELIQKNIFNILNNKNKGKKIKGLGSYTRKRNLKDGQLNLNDKAENILTKVRALSYPYPGAHIYSSYGEPIVIEKARLGEKSLKYKGSGKNYSENILCIAAHPDDEALGVGGTLIKHVEQGDTVNIVILSDGEGGKSKLSKKNPNRLKNTLEWCELTGCNLYKIYKFKDQKLDSTPLINIIKEIENTLKTLKPDIVYIHHPGDMNSDHQVAAQASLAALRPVNDYKPEIRSYETPSSTEQSPNLEPYIFKPNFYVSIDDQWKKKIEGLKCYSNELKDPPHPRSIKYIKVLAEKRGAEAGKRLCEAFYIVKKLWH